MKTQHVRTCTTHVQYEAYPDICTWLNSGFYCKLKQHEHMNRCLIELALTISCRFDIGLSDIQAFRVTVLELLSV